MEDFFKDLFLILFGIPFIVSFLLSLMRGMFQTKKKLGVDDSGDYRAYWDSDYSREMLGQKTLRQKEMEEKELKEIFDFLAFKYEEIKEKEGEEAADKFLKKIFGEGEK